MKIAHVRERSAPAGTPWRLAAAIDREGARWLDLEAARRALVRDQPAREHNSVLFRQPITTLDAHLGRGLRVEALADLLDADAEEPLEGVTLAFGPPVLAPPTFRDFYAFEQHVGTMWKRRDMEIPEAWYRLPIFYFSNVSEIRGPDDPVWAPRGSTELDFELEVAALIDTPVRDLDASRGAEAIGGYLILNDWSARDLQREETTVRLGPAKGKDFASSIGPWLVTPDELADLRTEKGFDITMTARVNDQELSRGNWSSAHFSFGDMVERASADVRLRPGDLLGSGTVGTGCLLEIRDDTLGRYLQPGDVVTLAIERLGEFYVARHRAAGAVSTAVDSLIERLSRVERRLAEHAAAPLPEGLSDPDPGGEERWEAGQVWAHIAEFPAYWLAQARRVIDQVTHPPVPFGRVKTDAGRLAAIERERHTDAPALLERVRTSLQEVVEAARGWDAEAWKRRGAHPTRGEMSVERIVEEFIVDHLEEHADQLDALAR